MPYLGNTPADRFTTTTVDTFNGDNSTTEFTLSRSATTNDVEVLVENVQQQPTTAYSISGTTLTFTSAPPTGTGNIYVIHRGAAISSVTPANGTVSVDMLSATGTKSGSTFLAGDNSFKTVAVTPTAVSSQANTATDFFALPKGTTAQRPGSPDNGYIRYNTTEGYIEEYREGAWAILSTVFTVSGGTEVTSGGYKYHTFTSSGTLSVTGTGTVDYLVIAGGGSGGANYIGAGGGAGGLLQGSLFVTGNLTLTVGAGGAGASGGTPTGGNNGVDSSIDSTVIAIGGGGGGTSGSNRVAGVDGGSGGGSGGNGSPTNEWGDGTSGQGNRGGAGWDGLSYYTTAGGGGGAGAVGGNASQAGTSDTSGGDGGIGLDYSAWATATSTGDSGYYAGGGGGATDKGGGANYNGSGGTGGTGGGGNGATQGSGTTSGAANTGGGGGGLQNTGTSGAGGSGIVIIRYAV